MHIEWLGHSAFRISGGGRDVLIDPFGPVPDAARNRGIEFDYPPLSEVAADLVLVSHEHFDHNGVEAAAGSPQVIRSTAGRLDSAAGEVVAVAAEHDPRAGTERGPNTLFVLELEGTRLCHLGDLGQRELRDEQAEAIDHVDLLFVPVGGGPTIDAAGAHAVVERLRPRYLVPMHYRTPAIGFLEPVDGFLDRFPAAAVTRLETASFDLDNVAAPGDGPSVVVPAPPAP